jgi:hypothetical protein
MQSLPTVTRSGDTSFLWAYGATTPNVRSQLQRFWGASGGIPDINEAWRRSFEVGCIAVDGSWEIAGVSSFYMDRLTPDGPMYWMYRTFVRPESRRSRLAIEIFNVSVDQLTQYALHERGAPVGVAAIIENPALELPEPVAHMQQLGLQRLGADQQGRSVWRRNFVTEEKPQQ